MFSYCVVELQRATQQRENKRKVFPVRENVFTVYWKCEAENANECGMKRCAKQQRDILSDNKLLFQQEKVTDRAALKMRKKNFEFNQPNHRHNVAGGSVIPRAAFC